MKTNLSIFKKSTSYANYLQANDYELHEGRSRDYLFSKTKILGTTLGFLRFEI